MGNRETSHATVLQGSELGILLSKPCWRDPVQSLVFLRCKCGLRMCSCPLVETRRLLRPSARSPGCATVITQPMLVSENSSLFDGVIHLNE